PGCGFCPAPAASFGRTCDDSWHGLSPPASRCRRRSRATLRGLEGAEADRTFRHMALVPAATPVLFDDLCGLTRYLLALYIIINVRISNAKCLLIWQTWLVIFQICGRNLAPGVLRGLKMLQHLCALAFIESLQWEKVCCAIAPFGEKACDILGSMIGADDQQILFASYGILRNHAQACLDIAAVEIT